MNEEELDKRLNQKIREIAENKERVAENKAREIEINERCRNELIEFVERHEILFKIRELVIWFNNKIDDHEHKIKIDRHENSDRLRGEGLLLRWSAFLASESKKHKIMITLMSIGGGTIEYNLGIIDKMSYEKNFLSTKLVRELEDVLLEHLSKHLTWKKNLEAQQNDKR